MKIFLRSTFSKSNLKIRHILLNGLVYNEQQANIQVAYHSTNIAPAHNSLSVNFENAKLITQCPTVTTFELIRGFLPGGKFYKKDTAHYLRTILREKGDTVFLPSLFGRPNIFITQNPDDFATIWRNEGIWPRRTQFYVLAYYRNVLRKEKFGKWHGLMTTLDKAWYDIRNIVNPILVHPKNVKIYLPVLSNITGDLIERIKQIRNPENLEVPADFKHVLSNWGLECTAVIGLDQRLGFLAGTNPDGVRIARSTQEFLELTAQLETRLSLWRYFPNRTLNRIIEILDEDCGIVEKYVDQAIKRIDSSKEEKPEDEKSVLEKLLKINRQIALVMAIDMMIAGTPTTTSTFAGLLLCLAKNPSKQQKLREEIRSILPQKTSSLTVESMKKLPYLRACIKENLRMYPIFLGNKRKIATDMVLSGYRVPKDTDCFMINMNLLKDEQHFPQANDFIPERWLRQPHAQLHNSSEKVSNACPMAGKSDTPFVYMPFGFGPRSCVGRRLAEMEQEIGIAHIVRNFHIEYNYPTENSHETWILSSPVIPLKFKFTDVTD